MIIGILKEPEYDKRVALIPSFINNFTKLGFLIQVEDNAGNAAFFENSEYSALGVEIKSRKEIFNSADILIQINPLSNQDIEFLRQNQIIISVFKPYDNADKIEKIHQKGAALLSLDMIPRSTRAQAVDVLSSMATVAGYKAVLEAANHLPKFLPMFMTAAGTIKPSKILILGAGVAGLQAIATARRLGAVVEAFDVRTAVKEEVESLGAKFVEVEGATDDKAAGGYAVEQTEEYKKRQHELIQKHAKNSNIVITTAQIPGRKAPLLITKETVENMPSGAVIVDLAASTGGNCEITENNKTILHNGITIIGNSNFASELPVDASQMFSKNLLNFINLMVKTENEQLSIHFEDEIVAACRACDAEKIYNKK